MYAWLRPSWLEGDPPAENGRPPVSDMAVFGFHCVLALRGTGVVC